MWREETTRTHRFLTFLYGPPQNVQRNPLVKYKTSLKSCLKRRRHWRRLPILFLTLTNFSEAKGHVNTLFDLFTLTNTLYSSLPSLRISLWVFSPPLGLVSEHEQISWEKLRMRYRMSVIYGHPVIAASRALRFADHVTKRNGGSGDENSPIPEKNGSCTETRLNSPRDIR